MKKSNARKTRRIAAALAALSIASAMALPASSVAASAAESSEIVYELPETAKKSHVRHDVKPKREADLKQFGFKTADYAAAANALLDSMNENICEMDSQLQSLNSKINNNTEWMGNKVENFADLSDLRNDFRSLSPEVAKLVKDIKSIQEDELLNKSRKIARIAAITDTARFDRITT